MTVIDPCWWSGPRVESLLACLVLRRLLAAGWLRRWESFKKPLLIHLKLSLEGTCEPTSIIPHLLAPLLVATVGSNWSLATLLAMPVIAEPIERS